VLGDPLAVKIVRRIFREFTDDERSTNEIANRLQKDGVPTPTGRTDKNGRPKPWRYDSVRTSLENPAYVGDFMAGRSSYGKFHTIRHGQIVPVGRKRRSRRNAEKWVVDRSRKPEAEWIVFRDHHEAIIDRRTFEAAKAILAKGKGRRRPEAEWR